MPTSAASNGPLLSAAGVTAGYFPRADVLHGCDVELRPGELVGIVGPNGAGKSTLLKTLFGLVPVRRGSPPPAGRRHHVHVPPRPRGGGHGLRPAVAERLRRPDRRGEPPASAPTSSPRAFAERYEHVTGIFPLLSERRRQRAGLMSGGERQLVAMGRALMGEPDVLLLDEPSAGLSPANQTARLRAGAADPPFRCGDRHGGAERPPLPADLRPRLRAGPRPERLHRHGGSTCWPTRRSSSSTWEPRSAAEARVARRWPPAPSPSLACVIDPDFAPRRPPAPRSSCRPGRVSSRCRWSAGRTMMI